MEDIPNNHLGWCKNPVNNEINCLSTGAGFWPSTVYKTKSHKMIGRLTWNLYVFKVEV